VKSTGNLNKKMEGTAEGFVQLSNRANPVAAEVCVNATGTRPFSPGAKRELFCEDTKTVVVFKDGAVIELSAAVAQGQLLFLTNKQSGQEVVCQVIRKRSFRPTSCYVELEFTEGQEDFWGVSFATAEAESAIPPAAEMVEAAEPSEEDKGQPLEVPKEEEVEQLRSQVSALREQLRLVKERKAAEEKAIQAQARSVVTSTLLPKPVAETRPAIRAEDLVPVGRPVPAAQADDVKLAETIRSMSAPAGTGAPEVGESDAPEDLLPQPELDFSKMPKSSVYADVGDANSIYKPVRKPLGKRQRAAVLLAILVMVVSGAAVGAYNHWLTLPTLANFTFWRTRKVGAAVTQAPVGKSVAKPGVTVPSGTVVGGVLGAGSAPELPVSGGAGEKAGDAKAEVGKATTAAAEETTGIAGKEGAEKSNEAAAKEVRIPAKGAHDEGRGAARVGGSAKKQVEGAPRAAGVVAVAQPEAVASGGVFVPAKLLKAASPVYPPDAMRGYITGDVRVDAVVESTGQVGEVKVIYGPKALREAAVEALKRYEYAPAKQGGRAVESHVVVTVKFWFDP
jgi:TonB family protein